MTFVFVPDLDAVFGRKSHERPRLKMRTVPHQKTLHRVKCFNVDFVKFSRFLQRFANPQVSRKNRLMHSLTRHMKLAGNICFTNSTAFESPNHPLLRSQVTRTQTHRHQPTQVSTNRLTQPNTQCQSYKFFESRNPVGVRVLSDHPSEFLRCRFRRYCVDVHACGFLEACPNRQMRINLQMPMIIILGVAVYG
jgi:hypothetical protein